MKTVTQPIDREKCVTVVQKLYAAFGDRDVPALLTVLSDDVEWGEPDNPFNPAAGTRHGHAGVLEWLRIGRQSEEILQLEPEQFLTNRDSIAVVGHMKCLAKPTGRIYESDFIHLVTFRDGKVAGFQEFFDTFAAGQAFRPEANSPTDASSHVAAGHTRRLPASQVRVRHHALKLLK